jgi:fatty acid desaturase/cytochrome b involved in lipid metabolism
MMMACAAAGLPQGGTLVEENIDAATFEQLATMPLMSVCLDALDRTWREWSTSTGFLIRRLLNRKHLTTEGTTTSSFQSISGDALRNNNESQKTTTAAAAAEAVGKSNVVMKAVSDSSSSYQQGVARITYFMEDVSLHSKPNDCWLVIKDKVYDVSRFAEQHPGGSVIYTHAGRDATDIFAGFHAPSTWKLLQQFYIGNYKSLEPTPELLKDYRELRGVFMRARLFKSSKLYYTLKCLVNALLLAASITIICLTQSLPAVLLSAFILGVCWQQCGWLSHDFLHHQVFETRWLNTFIGYSIGNVVLGFSTSWWKNKHNLHHAAPNECDQTYKPIDEDIDTLPLLAWSKDILATVDSQRLRRVLQWQHIFFFPMLMFSRFTWLLFSWLYCCKPQMSVQRKILEKGTMLMHYIWFIGIAFWLLNPSMAIIWIIMSEFITGALLSLVFILNHNGKEVYNTSKDFVNAQVASTRNIEANMFNDWFTGGLNRQIEHHLFPTMPRHNLNKISSHVRALCEKHGLVYEDLNITLGTYRVVEALAEVAAAATITVASS